MHGTEGAFAYTPTFNIRRSEITAHPKGYIHWVRYSTPALVFSHLTTSLILQGIDLRTVLTQRSFTLLCDVSEEDPVAPQLLDYGPFYLLKGALTPVYRPPLRLEDVVIARLMERPEGLTDLELVTYLIMTVCPPR